MYSTRPAHMPSPAITCSSPATLCLRTLWPPPSSHPSRPAYMPSPASLPFPAPARSVLPLTSCITSDVSAHCDSPFTSPSLPHTPSILLTLLTPTHTPSPTTPPLHPPYVLPLLFTPPSLHTAPTHPLPPTTAPQEHFSFSTCAHTNHICYVMLLSLGLLTRIIGFLVMRFPTKKTY